MVYWTRMGYFSCHRAVDVLAEVFHQKLRLGAHDARCTTPKHDRIKLLQVRANTNTDTMQS